MKIGKYISELLFENDFVILPEIGEFSTKYIPAKFVPELKKVESPSKVIVFNENNKSGGGLLIEYIAKKENISSVEAADFVNNFVAEMQSSLKSGRKVELDNVGVFSMNESGQLVFDPDTSINYLSDSAGMPPVREPERKSEEEAKTELDKAIEEAKAEVPPKKEEPAEKPEEKPKETEATQPVSKSAEVSQPRKPQTEKVLPPTPKKKAVEKKKQGLSPAVKWVALTVVPLLIIIIVLALNFDYIFGEKSVFRKSEVEPEPARVEAPAPVADEEPADDQVIEEETPAVTQEPVQPSPRQTTPATPEPGRKVYHIIVGSFEEEHSAQILVEELRLMGATNATVFPVNPLGFYRVSYGFYYDLNEAERELQDVQQDINPNAWVLHR